MMLLIMCIAILQSFFSELTKALCYHPGHEPGIFMNFSQNTDEYGRYPKATIVNAVCDKLKPVTLSMECQINGEWLAVTEDAAKFHCAPNLCELQKTSVDIHHIVFSVGEKCYSMHAGLYTSTFEYWHELCNKPKDDVEWHMIYQNILRHCETFCSFSRNKRIIYFLQQPPLDVKNFFLNSGPHPFCNYINCMNCIHKHGIWEDTYCSNSSNYWICTYDITGCGIPGQFSYTQMDYTGIHFQNTASYQCPPGFSPASGNTTRTCEKNGKWSGQPLLCRRKRCAKPSNSTLYKLLNESLVYGSWVEHWCPPELVMTKGTPFRMCTQNGTWSGQIPVCEPKPTMRISSHIPSCLTTEDIIGIIIGIVVVVLSMTWITVGIILYKDRHSG